MKGIRLFSSAISIALWAFAFFFFIPDVYHASHLMGGDMNYTFVSKNSSLATYQITVKKYRDCNSTAGFDNAINYGIYNTSNSKIGGSSASMVSGYPKSVTPSCIPKSDVCIEEAIYTFTVQVPVNQAVYVTTERGNRNSAIVNTSNPANYNMIWSVYIPPTNTSQNNSVTFLSQPLPYLCKGYSMSFNHLATDPDGDSLVFGLVAPYGRTGFANTNGIAPNLIAAMPWASGYSLSAPLGSGSSISIDPATGEITAYAANAGNFVIAVEVKEYRKNTAGNWVYLGAVRRDLQFVVKNCTNYYPPKFVSWGGTTDRNVTLGDSVCFTVSLQDTLADSIFVSPNGSIFSASMGGSEPFATMKGGVGKNSAAATVCWKPACHQVRTAPYVFTLSAEDKNCGKTEKTFSITVKPMGSSTVPVFRCLDIQGNSKIALTWVNPSDVTNIRSYRIYRRIANTGSYVYVDSTTDAAITTFTDNNASNAYSNRYQYIIRSINKCDSLSPSDTITAIDVSNVKTYTYQTEARWTKLKPSFKNLYTVYYNEGNGWNFLKTTADTFASFAARACYRSVWFKVETMDSVSSCVSHSDTSAAVVVEDVVIPNVMGLKVATVDSTNNLIRVRWYKNDSNDVKNYLIYRRSPIQGFTLVRTQTADTNKEQTWVDSSAGINDYTQAYCYKIQAVDSCGNQGAMYEEHCPCNIQGVAGNLQNNLFWHPAKGNGFDSIKIYRKTSSGSWALVKNLQNTDSLWTDTGLICKQTYTYKLLFPGNVDTTSLSWSDTLQLTPYDTVPPVAPTLSYVTVAGDKKINIYFKKSPSGDVKYYDIYRSDNGAAASVVQTFIYPVGTSLTWSDTNVNTLSNRYCYHIVARDSCYNLNSAPSVTHCAIQLLSRSGNNRALLSWYGYKGLTPDNYKLYKWVNGSYTLLKTITSITDTNYIDSVSVSCGTNIYKIEATQTSSGIVTSSDTVTVIPIDTLNPASPSLIYVNVLGKNVVRVQWASSSTDVDRYVIRRSVNRGAFQVVDTLGLQNVYIDSNVITDSAVYSYSLEALDSCQSNSSGITPPHNTIHLRKYFDYCNRKYYITFNPYINWVNGVNQYTVYRRANGGAFSAIANISDTVFVDSTVASNNYYQYRVVATENGGNNSISQSDTLDLLFFPIRGPRLFTATKSATSPSTGAVTLEWNAQYYDSFVLYSRLYYSPTGAVGTWSLIYNNIPKSVTSYTHTGLNTQSADHYYYMTNVDSCGKNTDSTGIHKTMTLSVIPRKVRNRLNFTPYEGFTPCVYFILRQDTGNMRIIDTIASTDTFFTDFPSPCNGWVHYRIGAQDCNGGYIAYSDTVSLPPMDTTSTDSAALFNVTITSDNYAYIEFIGNDTSDILGYVLKRSEDNGPFNTVKLFLFQSPGYKYIWYDTVDVLNKTFQYRIYVLDSCLNSTPSSIFKAIQLKGTSHHLSNHFYWNTFKGYPLSKQYIQYFQNGVWYNLDSVSVSDSQYLHKQLLCNQTWNYRIVGIENGEKNRVTYSDTLHLTPFDSIPPSAVTLHQAEWLGSGTFRVSWKNSSPDVGKYYIQTLGSVGQTLRWDTAGMKDTQIVISGLNTKDSVYSFTVLAADSCSNNVSSAGNLHTSSLIQAKALNKAALLSWTRYRGFNKPKEIIQKWHNGVWVDYYQADTLSQQWTDDSSGMGLGCGTSQYYRLKTVDGINGRICYSDSVLAIPFDTVAPLPPTLKYVSWNDSSSISIAWTNSPSPDVNQYDVFRSQNGGAFSLLKTISYDSNFKDSSVSHLDKYAYYVVAIDSCNQNNRSITSDTDATFDIRYIFQACLTEATLQWDSIHPFENGVSKYILVGRDSTGATVFSKDISVGQLQYTDSTVSLYQSRYYTISKIEKTSGFLSQSSMLKVIPWIYPLPSPHIIYTASVSKTGITDGQIGLSWNRAPLSDTLSKGYYVYLSKSGAPASFSLYKKITNVNDTLLILDSIETSSGNTYAYVLAYDVCNREGPKSPIHKTIDLKATGENMQNSLAWTRYQGFPVQYYVIERWDPGSLNPGMLALLDSNTFSFVDTLVSCNLTYRYVVYAQSAFRSDDKAYSDIDSATTFDTLASEPIFIQHVSTLQTDMTIGKILVTFQGSNERNRMGYRIFRSSGSGFYRVADYVTPSNVNLSWLDNSGLNTRDSVYQYYLTVFDSCGNVSTPSDTHAQINLSAFPVNHAVELNWTAYKGWKIPYNYAIERLDPGQSVWKVVTRVSSDSLHFTDSAVICNLTYAYRISGEDTLGHISWSDTVQVTTFENDPPEATTLKFISTEFSHNVYGIIRLNWNPSPSNDAESYVIYRRSAGDTTFTQVGKVFRALTFADAGLNTVDSVYFYKILVIDSCGNVALSFSPEHGSLVLTTKPGEQSISLSWNHYQGWVPTQYDIWRNGTLVHTAIYPDTMWLDTPLSCITSMYYQIIAQSGNSGIQSRSDSSFDKAYDHIPPASVYLKRVTVEEFNNIVKLEWEQSTGFDIAYYEIFRKPNGTNAWKKLKRTYSADTVLFDTIPTHLGSFCYRITAADSCSNTSESSNEACLIYLTGKASRIGHPTAPGILPYNEINFTPYAEWKGGVNRYEIYRSDDGQPRQLLKTVVDSPFTLIDTFFGNQVREFCYEIQAYQDTIGYREESRSNQVCLVQQPIFWIPNAFSPNEDDVNDVFGLNGIYYEKYDLTLYNRWGQVIFSESGKKPYWDGTDRKGEAVPSDYYMYMFKIYSYDGREYNVSGNIFLMR